ncbi:uncharacterized protein LOC124943533 [Impatiens glandulifera]|uniref:uncharacterized protein LOC124943533 n=1 Tax=Impatiens glandulifera TaxID=253017 RepID=UPI001FB0D216|nr:uncharacterized protein LOC124943533 [Impatiens glandulifera]
MDHSNGIRRINTHVPDTPKTPKAGASPTFEELLQASDALKWSPLSGKDHHDDEQDFGHHNNMMNKKSVLAKMREKAKRLKNSISKRKHDQEDTGTPPWGVSLHDEDEEDHFASSMHKLEVAPPNHVKEIPKQHRINPNPRAITVVSEKHVLPNTIKQDINEGENEDDKKEDTKLENISNTARILTKSVSERLAPAYNIVSDATCIIASKIGLFAINTSEPVNNSSKGNTMDVDHQTNNTEKGVSENVKNYLMQKLEPGEDEKALSQVISEAISPKKIHDHNEMGVMEKVRGAFTALLYRNPISQKTQNDQNNNSSSVNK